MKRARPNRDTDPTIHERGLATDSPARLEQLFWEGLSLPSGERGIWLAQLPVDARLRKQLKSMLDADVDGADVKGYIGAALVSASGLPAGTQLGPYRIVRELGRGGGGVVFLAERADHQFQRQVAIKLISGVAAPEAASQLRHERRLLATLDHPGIARLLDSGETTDGHPYLVMDYVQGVSITNACREGNLTIEERVRVVMEVAQAVEFAHQRLVIHRDIKPENVLVRADGRPVLLDFGIAKLLDTEQRSTITSRKWCTPAYASPEQRRGDPVGVATDVYALGILLFEVLTGELPILGRTNQIRLSDSGTPSLRRQLRGELDAIVSRACSHDVEDRYPSAATLAEDLRRWLAGYPIQAARNTWFYVLRKFVRRRPLEFALLVFFSLVTAFAGWRLAEQRNQALRHARDTQAVTTFLVEIFRQGEPARAGRRVLTAEDLADLGAQRLEGRAALPDRQRAQIAGTLGALFRSLGEPKKATLLLTEAVEYARRSHAPAVELGEHLRQLASALDHRGLYASAEARYAETIELMQPYTDPGLHARDLSRLGLMQSRQRRFSAAEQTLRSAAAIAREAFGSDSPHAAEAELYLAELLALADRSEEALRLVERPMRVLHASLAPDDPALLSAMAIHANVLRENAKSQEAKDVLLEVLRRRRSVLSDESWLISSIHNALGHVYYEEGRTIESAKHFLESLELARRTLSEDDPALALSLNNYGSVQEERAAYADAEALLREALAIVESNPDGHELQVMRYRQNLGRALLLGGNLAGARPLLDAEIPAREDPRFKLQKARQLVHLAEWHRQAGDLDEAIRLLDEMDASASDLGGQSHPRYAFALRTRAKVLSAKGDVEGARMLLLRAAEVAAAARGAAYVGSALAKLEYCELSILAGEPADARNALAEARPVLVRVLVADAPELVKLRQLEAQLSGN